MNKYLDGVS